MSNTNAQSTSTPDQHLSLPHHLNEDNLCTYNPIPVRAIPVSAFYNPSLMTRPTMIDHCFEVWNPPEIKEDVDYEAEAPETYVVDEFIDYYVCKQCFGLKHRFCGMDVTERWRFEEPWPQNKNESEWKVKNLDTKLWGPCWDENPWETDWWKNADQWAKWGTDNQGN
uniref:Uncharacterized protein n=1 Tax=Moniliophthora roreri TaxID=221103 RepID=A0A0W0G5A9_MONRR